MEAYIIEEGKKKPEVVEETKGAMFASHGSGGGNDENNFKPNEDNKSADLPLEIDDADKSKLDSGLTLSTISPGVSSDRDEFPISQKVNKKHTTRQDLPIPLRLTQVSRASQVEELARKPRDAENVALEERLTVAEEKLRETGEKLKKHEEKLRDAEEKLRNVNEKMRRADKDLKSADDDFKRADEKCRVAKEKLKKHEEKLRKAEEMLKKRHEHL